MKRSPDATSLVGGLRLGGLGFIVVWICCMPNPPLSQGLMQVISRSDLSSDAA